MTNIESTYVLVSNVAATSASRLGETFDSSVYKAYILDQLNGKIQLETDVIVPIKIDGKIYGHNKVDIVIDRKILVAIKAGKSGTNAADVQQKLEAIAKHGGYKGGIVLYFVFDEEADGPLKLLKFETGIEDRIVDLDVKEEKVLAKHEDIVNLVELIKECAEDTAEYLGEGLDAAIYTKVLLHQMSKTDA